MWAGFIFSYQNLELEVLETKFAYVIKILVFLSLLVCVQILHFSDLKVNYKYYHRMWDLEERKDHPMNALST